MSSLDPFVAWNRMSKSPFWTVAEREPEEIVVDLSDFDILKSLPVGIPSG